MSDGSLSYEDRLALAKEYTAGLVEFYESDREREFDEEYCRIEGIKYHPFNDYDLRRYAARWSNEDDIDQMEADLTYWFEDTYCNDDESLVAPWGRRFDVVLNGENDPGACISVDLPLGSTRQQDHHGPVEGVPQALLLGVAHPMALRWQAELQQLGVGACVLESDRRGCHIFEDNPQSPPYD